MRSYSNPLSVSMFRFGATVLLATLAAVAVVAIPPGPGGAHGGPHGRPQGKPQGGPSGHPVREALHNLKDAVVDKVHDLGDKLVALVKQYGPQWKSKAAHQLAALKSKFGHIWQQGLEWVNKHNPLSAPHGKGPAGAGGQGPAGAGGPHGRGPQGRGQHGKRPTGAGRH